MKTLPLKLLLINLAGLLVITMTAAAQGPGGPGGPGPHAMERMEQLKKMKLLDLLELDEKTSEKFLVKYNALESNIKNKRDQLDSAYAGLEDAIRSLASYDEIEKKVSDVMRLEDELYAAEKKKITEMKAFLPPDKFAKYLVFEHNFIREVRRHIFRMMRGGRGGMNGPGPMGR